MTVSPSGTFSEGRTTVIVMDHPSPFDMANKSFGGGSDVGDVDTRGSTAGVADTALVVVVALIPMGAVAGVVVVVVVIIVATAAFLARGLRIKLNDSVTPSKLSLYCFLYARNSFCNVSPVRMAKARSSADTPIPPSTGIISNTFFQFAATSMNNARICSGS